MPKKFTKKDKADVHSELKGFEISINSFGEMETNYSIEKLNEFLNKKVEEDEKKDKDTPKTPPQEGVDSSKFSNEN